MLNTVFKTTDEHGATTVWTTGAPNSPASGHVYTVTYPPRTREPSVGHAMQFLAFGPGNAPVIVIPRSQLFSASV